MSRTFRILFGDNEPGRHELFLQLVIPKLEKRFGEGYKFHVDHSQSVDPVYQGQYDPWLQEKGAQSVRSFLASGWDGDLVISDVNYDKKVKMGAPHTGADVGREIATRKKLHWCEVIWMTRYTQEQTAELHIEMGGILPGRCHFVEMSATDPERNWDRVADLAARCLQDALVVRDGLSEPPKLYRIRLFDAPKESSVCLAVWHKTDEDCLYKKVFDGHDRDIIMALHSSAGKFVPLNKLMIMANKQAVKRDEYTRTGFQSRAPRIPRKEYEHDHTQNSVRAKVEKIRDTFPKGDSGTDASDEIRRAGKMHSGRHSRGVVCGFCVVLNPERGGQGYAFGGESDVRELLESFSIDGVLKNPQAVWEQLGGGGTPVGESAMA